MSTWLITNIHN